ncbi:MAG: chemotaxis protein CheW [Acidimicrobiales bacterium]
MDEVVNEFLVESYELLDDIDQGLLALEERPDDVPVLERIFRALHTIKGTCGFLGFDRLEKLAHAAENLLSLLREGTLALDERIADVLLASVDSIRNFLTIIESSGSDEGQDASALVERLHELASAPAADTPAASTDDAPAAAVDAGDTPEPAGPPQEPEPAAEAIAAEPAARPAEPAAPSAPPPAPANEAPAAEATAKSGAKPSSSSAADSTIRVDVSLLDELMNLVGELVLTRNEIMQLVDERRDNTFGASSQRLNIITSELQEGVMKTRMQPIGNVWNKLPRVVRDLSHQMGKRVRIEMDGKDTELDKTIIEATKDPLTHIVRNTVDHGIEAPEKRRELGKDPEGVLHFRAAHEGGQVNIEISDDGAGIDVDIIKRKAVERGLITPDVAEKMSDSEATHLIFLPGFSTAAAVTNVSGRGVGMDVVKTNIEKIGGSVEIRSQKGEGTTFKIKIPLTLAIIPALSVQCGGNRYAIPQINLIELVRVEAGADANGIEYVHGAPVYRLRGRLLPIVDLREVLGCPPGESDVANIVVLQADDRQFGVIVDEINETQEIVVKPLGHVVQDLALYSGATILGDGRVALILDILGLAQQSRIISSHGEPTAFGDAGEVADFHAATETEAVLVLGLNERRVAVPLSAVARLEEFAATSLEEAGHSQVVQYRGQIMPMIDLGMALGYGPLHARRDDDMVNVVVYQHAGRDVGLMVGEILDIVELDRVAGATSVVIGDRVTDLFDVAETVARELPADSPILWGAMA